MYKESKINLEEVDLKGKELESKNLQIDNSVINIECNLLDNNSCNLEIKSEPIE